MVGVNGSKFPAIRTHLQENIGNVYKDMDTSYAFSWSFCRHTTHFLSQVRCLPGGRFCQRGSLSVDFKPLILGLLLTPLTDKDAINKLSPGDAVIIFTPDSEYNSAKVTVRLPLFPRAGTHYPIALYAIERGLHVLVTKPAVQLLKHHSELVAAAAKKGVVCFVEHHKR